MRKLVSNVGQGFPATRTAVLEDFVRISAVRLIGMPTLSDIKQTTFALPVGKFSRHEVQESTAPIPATSKTGSVISDDSRTMEKRVGVSTGEGDFEGLI